MQESILIINVEKHKISRGFSAPPTSLFIFCWSFSLSSSIQVNISKLISKQYAKISCYSGTPAVPLSEAITFPSQKNSSEPRNTPALKTSESTGYLLIQRACMWAWVWSAGRGGRCIGNIYRVIQVISTEKVVKGSTIATG